MSDTKVTATMERTLPTSGLHDGIPEQEYHADPDSLSSTGAKTLLFDGPRAFQWARQHPIHKDAYDLGSVVHALILGVGDYAVVDADSWRTKAAQEQRETIRADGSTPILRKDYDAAEAMRDAVMGNQLAAAILTSGRSEVSLWATDPDTGILMRGRIDSLGERAFTDVKTVAGAVDPVAFGKVVWNFHYHVQAAWYRRILALNGIDLPPLHIALSKATPHEVYIHQIDADLLTRGDQEVDRALNLYARCVETDTWPGLYDDHQIHTITAPPWA